MIVYYSLGGTSKLHADMLAFLTNHEARELHEEKPRGKDILGMIQSGFESVFNVPAKLTDVPDVSREKVIYICAPIWAGRVCTPVRAFIKLAGLSGKRVNAVLLCNSADAKSKKEYEDMFMRLLYKENCKIGFVSAISYPRGQAPDTDLVRKRLKKLVLKVDETK